jgi:hypothetical protein
MGNEPEQQQEESEERLHRDQQKDAIADLLLDDDDAGDDAPESGTASEAPEVVDPRYTPPQTLDAFEQELNTAADNLVYDLQNNLITRDQFEQASQALLQHEQRLREARIQNVEAVQQDQQRAQQVIAEVQTFHPEFKPGSPLHEQMVNIGTAAGYTREQIEATRDPIALRLLADLASLKMAERNRVLKRRKRKKPAKSKPAAETKLSKDQQVDEIAKLLIGG